MGINNRDRIGTALDLMAGTLDRYIENVVGDKLPAGKDWTGLLATRDNERGRLRSDYKRTDLQNQLRVLTENLGQATRTIQDHLSHTEKSLAIELREVRNKWAHTEPFSSDDTYRALDSVERLLRAVGATKEADTVRASRRAVQHEQVASEVRSKARASSVALDSDGLPPWREVLRPHPDIESGKYAAAEFAADLYLVAQERADKEYNDPVEFFRRTYVTDGLRDLLARSAARVCGDTTAAPVINLQTNFGGGKTHSMLAVWHLFSGRPIAEFPQEVQEAVAGRDLGKLDGVRRVAIVGNEIPPGDLLRKKDGTEVRTLWGELAWQLGRREGYEMVAESDRTATNPGALDDLFRRFGPVVILIDEWVAYARQLHSRDDLRGGTFETQFTFAQTLTESIKRVPGVLLLVSIPASDVRRDEEGETRDASDLEIGGVYGREALDRLQNVVGRLAHNWSPASSRESFEIVRRRLFLDPTPERRTQIGVVAKRFVEFYRKHRGQFPSDTSEPEYEQRVRAAYPVHPELFDRLYEDWSSLERFQRTRGVLRLMSGVVHELLKSEDRSPLIMPGSVPLDRLRVRDEIAGYLEDTWKPIIDADIDGENAVPLRIDNDSPLFGKRSLARRVARTVFLGSAPRLHSSHKGIERQRVFLGVALPGDTVGNFGSALQVLGDRSTYFYADGESYWYDLHQSLGRVARDYAEGFDDERVWNDIVDRLMAERSRPGDFASVVIAPLSTAEVDDVDETRLVIVHPKYVHSRVSEASTAAAFVKELIEKRGGASRERRNTIIALAADNQRVAELSAAVRSHLAWRQILDREVEMNLNQQQLAQANRRRAETGQAVEQRLHSAYIWALYPNQPDGGKPFHVAAQKVEGSENRLAERTGRRLVADDVLRVQTNYHSIRMDLDRYLRSRWNDGRITFGELWDYYTRHPYLARLRDRRVLADAVAQMLSTIDVTWTQRGFALASGYDSESGDFLALVIPTQDDAFGPILDTTLLVSPNLALAQRERERLQAAPVVDEEANTDVGETVSAFFASEGETAKGGTYVSDAGSVVRNARYEARVDIDPSGDLEEQLNALVREVLVHLQRQEPEAFEVRVDISAERLDGFSDTAARTVSENARTLGFTRSRFEEGR